MWQLIQINQYRAPRYNADTSVAFNFQDVTVDLPSGGRYDWHRYDTAPFVNAEVKHTGTYGCCNVCGPSCAACRHELEGIKSLTGTYCRFLFAADYKTCRPLWQPATIATCKDVITRYPTTQYAWAYGKISVSPNPASSTESARWGGRTQVEISAILETPLRSITHGTWRYGDAPVIKAARYPNGLAHLQLTQHAEQTNAEPRSQWYVPSDLVSCCGAQRFYPRTLYWQCDHCAEFMNPANWDAEQLYTLVPGQPITLWVDGTAPPHVKWLALGAPTRAAELDLWHGNAEPRHYCYTFPCKRAYLDTLTGDAACDVAADGAPCSLTPPQGLCRFPALVPGENRLESLFGTITLGVTPMFI